MRKDILWFRTLFYFLLGIVIILATASGCTTEVNHLSSKTLHAQISIDAVPDCPPATLITINNNSMFVTLNDTGQVEILNSSDACFSVYAAQPIPEPSPEPSPQDLGSQP